MTIKEFIKRYNVGFKDEEQQQDFAAEMRRDLHKVIEAHGNKSTNPAKVKTLKKWCKSKLKFHFEALEEISNSIWKHDKRIIDLEQRNNIRLTEIEERIKNKYS